MNCITNSLIHKFQGKRALFVVLYLFSDNGATIVAKVVSLAEALEIFLPWVQYVPHGSLLHMIFYQQGGTPFLASREVW